VQAAINSAVNGDTVNIPAGSCTWTSTVSWTNKGIKLIGAGSDPGGSVISISTTAIISIVNAGTVQNPSRVSGIRFSWSSYIEKIVEMRGRGWRVDHCYLNNTSGQTTYWVYAEGANTDGVTPYGLADHNTLIEGRVYVYGAYSPSVQYEVWSEDSSLGTGNAVYFEDDIFYRVNEGSLFNDGSSAGKWVLRYNTIIGPDTLYGHGAEGEGQRSVRSWEYYGNKFTDVPQPYSPFIRARGGTGVIFNNYITNNFGTYFILFDNPRSIPTDCSGCGAWGYCEGNSVVDGNTPGQAGYPCRDQIGRGKDSSLFNPPNYPSQALDPVYLWSNLRNGGMKTSAEVSGEGTNTIIIQANRDYYDFESPFSGASGTGCGTLANRPSECTTGVGYWATNQSCTNLTGMVGKDPSTPIAGALYKCTATKTWTAYYTPYTYPHPLRAGDTDQIPTYNAADTNKNSCVETSEMVAYISLWKNNLNVSLKQIVDAIMIWKEGC
jgi:hypothetical protein